ncbi:MAG TPA: hypothetical protein VK208_14115 [Pyrinomonadaceae bacterium]|jgi:hypothetical protein|nr:hypothetical protein [Pyrinomonadaceae bacterium]
MRRLIVTTALMASICSSIIAGDIPSVGAPAPQPTQTTTTTAPGDIPTLGVAEQLTSDALSTLVTMLGFLTV